MNAASIFAEVALERPDESDRRRFLSMKRGENQQLREELEELLKAHREAGGFLDLVDRPELVSTHIFPEIS
ncbi:MAG: hypothetical protein R3C49_21815 [Planctomycetaceae bacterium]